MYQQAQQTIVDNAAAIFLDHGLSFLLVKPSIKGYVLTPISIPIERYLSIDPTRRNKTASTIVLSAHDT
jgi:hypothetical protein